jgi:hypothetical protein
MLSDSTLHKYSKYGTLPWKKKKAPSLLAEVGTLRVAAGELPCSEKGGYVKSWKIVRTDVDGVAHNISGELR